MKKVLPFSLITQVLITTINIDLVHIIKIVISPNLKMWPFRNYVDNLD